MNEKKLAEIGDKLDISKEDISTVKRQYKLTKIISLITGTITVFLSYAIGSYRGNAMGEKAAQEIFDRNLATYPLAVPSLFFSSTVIIGSKDYLKSIKMKRNIFLLVIFVLTIILSILVYSSAYENAYDAAQEHIPFPVYGVYSKER